jgi:hypothetical protein
MSDFSISQYDEKKDDKNGQDPFSGALTKSQHRNPDIHVVGDNLPAELVAYQAGSGTLLPDVAGNTLQIERQTQKVDGNSISQALTTTDTLIGNLTVSVTCPLQAATGAKVRLQYKVQLTGAVAGGPNANFAKLSIYVNGVIYTGLDASSYYQTHGLAAGGVEIWHVSEVSEIPINPGQTLVFSVRGNVATTTTPYTSYSANTSSDRSGIRASLIY